MNALRPKSKMHKRRNKANAKARKAILLGDLKKAITAFKGEKPAKAKTAKKKEAAAVG